MATFMEQVDESNELSSEESVTQACPAETKETSVIVSRVDNPKTETSMFKRTLELRKDLHQPDSYQAIDEENGLYKNDSFVADEQQGIENHQPSYVTLTPCQVPSVIHPDEDSPGLSNDVPHNSTQTPNTLNMNPNCWMPGHDENVILSLPPYHHLGSPEILVNNLQLMSAEASMLEYSHSSFMMMEDPFKTNMTINPNTFYHLDTNNGRLWVPESCSIRSNTSSIECNSPPTGVRLTSVHESDIYMAAEFENEELLQQHAVSIQRFPNRCWRGSNSSRAQYEKGIPC